MSGSTNMRRKPTALQREYLDALRDGKKLGKQLRDDLRRRGMNRKNAAFYRIMQRLKRDALVTAASAHLPMPDYSGHERYYELTEAGRALVGPKLKRRKARGRKELNWASSWKLKRSRACSPST